MLEGGAMKNKLSVLVQRCLCVGEKCQPSPIVCPWADLWEWDLGSHCHSIWFLVKGKEIWLLPPDKNTEKRSLLGQKTTYFSFLVFFVIWACQIGLSNCVGGTEEDAETKNGGGRKEVKKTFGLVAWCMGGRGSNGSQSVLVCKSLQQVGRICGRSETLSLEVVMMNILARFWS